MASSAFSESSYNRLKLKLTVQDNELCSLRQSNAQLQQHSRNLGLQQTRVEKELLQTKKQLEKYFGKILGTPTLATPVCTDQSWDASLMQAISKNATDLRRILEIGMTADVEVDSAGIDEECSNLSKLDLLPDIAVHGANEKKKMVKKEATPPVLSWTIFKEIVEQNLRLKEHLIASKEQYLQAVEYQDLIALLKADLEEHDTDLRQARMLLAKQQTRHEEELLELNRQKAQLEKDLRRKDIIICCYHDEYQRILQINAQLQANVSSDVGIKDGHLSNCVAVCELLEPEQNEQKSSDDATTAGSASTWEFVFKDNQQRANAETCFMDDKIALSALSDDIPTMAHSVEPAKIPEIFSGMQISVASDAAAAASTAESTPCVGLHCKRCLRQFGENEMEQYDKHVMKCWDD